ncbi:LOW QUALITY PROTEIN: actin-like protein 10 [Porphyrio hochstetteri]
MPKPPVVIDNGSSFTKAGFAGQKKPKFVLRTTAGTTWETQQHPATAENFAAAPQTSLKHSIIEDWGGMENLSHLFCGLKAPPEEQPVLMADSPSCPSNSREKAAEVLCESFRVPALHMANGFLSLCTYSRVTGLAVEAGAGVSHVTSICLGQTQREAMYCLGVAGGLLSSHLQSLLMESPSDPTALRALKKKTVIQLKKQCCYVSMDYEGDLHNRGYHHPARFQAPHEAWITLDKEQFCCPEPLFQPHLLHQSSDLALQSLQKAPNHTRKDMMGNIMLSGGSSTFPGFPERMCLELNTSFHSTGCQVQVLVSLERGSTAWAGGSMAVSLTSFQHMWVVKGQHQEHGAKHKVFQ